MRRPFSIEDKEKIESGEYKLITRDGREAKVLDWSADLEDNNEIVCTILNTTTKKHFISTYPLSGLSKYKIMNYDKYSPLDLFVIDENGELSEFEGKLVDLISAWGMSNKTKTLKEFVHTFSEELIDLAKKCDWRNELRDE